MHGGSVERVLAVANAQKARALFESFFAEARHVFQIATGTECAVFVAIGDDVCGDARVQPGNVAEQLFRRGVDLDADFVHAGNDDVVQRAFQRDLVHVVLILPDADAFRINFHELGERIHQPAPD